MPGSQTSGRSSDVDRRSRHRNGRFAEEQHPESVASLPVTADRAAAGSEAPCTSCGKATQRRSGLCRRCDPARATKRQSKKGPVAGVEHVKTSGVLLDRSQPPLTAEDIFQCDYAFVPVYRSGARVEGAVRECRNAVTVPGRCHQHGGDKATSLGRTVSKARAEAERGECWPLSAEHWEQADQRLAVAEGQLLAMLDADIDGLAAMWVQFAAHEDKCGTSRFSDRNQLLLLSQHWFEAHAAGLRGSEAMDHALAMMAEPHMTAEAWARVGRTPLEDASPVGVLWWQRRRPANREPDTDEPDDEDGTEPSSSQRAGVRGRHGARLEYPLSATSGEPYDVPKEPLAAYRPAGHGDPAAAIGTMRTLAEDMGIRVRFVDRQPGDAYGYWSPLDSEIVVWSGVADGDPAAQAHVLAHELGHARLGHSTDASTESRTPDKEVAAESFAALACAHHGLDTSHLSAWYVDGWRRGAGIDMTAGGLGPVRSALEAFDDYKTATLPAAPDPDESTDTG